MVRCWHYLAGSEKFFIRADVEFDRDILNLKGAQLLRLIMSALCGEDSESAATV